MSLEFDGYPFSEEKLCEWLAANNGRLHILMFAYLLSPPFRSFYDANTHFLLSSFLPLFQLSPQSHLRLG
jgi:hypothetical protein